MSEKCPCCGAPVRKCRKCGEVEYDPPYVPWYPVEPMRPDPYPWQPWITYSTDGSVIQKEP